MCSNALVGSNLKCVIVIKCSVTNSAGPREKKHTFCNNIFVPADFQYQREASSTKWAVSPPNMN